MSSKNCYKIPFLFKGEAKRMAKRNSKTHGMKIYIYECPMCIKGTYHMTKSKPNKKENERRVQ